ncbi:MAG: hypothetical protein QXH24_06195 [Candidatus Bathyarchaeia archaeon]
MYSGKKILVTVLVMLLVILAPANMLIDAQETQTEHIYYGYVPPSMDVNNPNAPEGQPDEARRVEEMKDGQSINYYVPSGSAILDIVGYEDGTVIEIVDIYANWKIASDTINRFEKKHFFIPFGTFFKVIASKRVGVFLSGGANIYEPDGREEPPGGTSTFYPSLSGGFRGREFIFVAAPATHPMAYSKDRIGYNFYLFALEEADWALSDSVQKWSQSGHLSQRGTRQMILQSRTFYRVYAETHGGGGYDTVFYLTTTGDVMVSSCGGLDDFMAVPAVTGGYVGKVFYASAALTFGGEGRTVAFVIIPLEECDVTVYDGGLNVIAKHSFTASDVANRNYWFHTLGEGRFDFIVESTGSICFMVGKTDGAVDINSLGDDITFMGARPDQEVRFYAPTAAVIFAPEDLTVSIDGGAPIRMERDEFRLLESGAHSIKADKHIIIEVLAAGNGWTGWGSYLIEPLDLDVTFEVPENLLSKGADYTNYIIAGSAIAVIVVIAVLVLRMRRRTKHV